MTDRHDTDADPSAPDALWAGTEADAGASDTRRRNRRLLLVLLVVGLGMFAFAFANVPLFGLLCQKLGIAQNPGLGTAAAIDDGEAPGREISVSFLGTSWSGLPVDIRPVKSVQKSRLGQSTLNDFVFINLSREPVYLRPVHSIVPSEAARPDRYKLLKCFCYEEMMLQPGQELKLPVVYTFSRDLSPSVRSVTMSYTLFPITKKEYEAAKARKEQGT